MFMKIMLASVKEAKKVYDLVQETIKSVYPNYYPSEVVNFFCNHHNLEAIKTDIDNGAICLFMEKGEIIGTGSYKENHITRVFVNPIHQGKGFGTKIIKHLEDNILDNHKEVYLDASLPAAALYEKLGYKSIKHERCFIENNRVLVYEVMKKSS